MSKLVLSWPVKPLFEDQPVFVNQPFGTNPKTYKQFGLAGHNGLDLAARHGQPLYASHDGVAYLSIDANEGFGVVLLSDKEYDYKGDKVYFKTIYWHLCNPKKEPQFPIVVKDNQKVKRGDLLGYADNTGFSTGDHLHYGLKPVDKYNEAGFTFYNVAQNNGYYGAIDPASYMEGFQFLFKKDLAFMTWSEDNRVLQEALMIDGCMQWDTPTNYYGVKTKAAVQMFQEKHGIKHNFGLAAGPLTRAMLNKLKIIKPLTIED